MMWLINQQIGLIHKLTWLSEIPQDIEDVRPFYKDFKTTQDGTHPPLCIIISGRGSEQKHWQWNSVFRASWHSMIDNIILVLHAAQHTPDKTHPIHDTDTITDLCSISVFSFFHMLVILQTAFCLNHTIFSKLQIRSRACVGQQRGSATHTIIVLCSFERDFGCFKVPCVALWHLRI